LHFLDGGAEVVAGRGAIGVCKCVKYELSTQFFAGQALIILIRQIEGGRKLHARQNLDRLEYLECKS